MHHNLRCCASLIAACVLSATFGTSAAVGGFRVIREWQYVNYTWPSAQALEAATANGLYSPRGISMAGLAHFSGYFYITTPRMLPGTPATLSRIRERDVNTAPLLQPFPSWRYNNIGECDALQNVQNVQIDPQGYMYIIDSGRINTLLPNSIFVCPPKLVKYDLNASETMWQYEFPADVADGANYLYDLVLDEDYVYISDNSKQDPGIVVFSEREMTSWKVRHSSFKAEEEALNITVNGITLRYAINLGGLALGPWNEAGTDRLLYYTPISSFYLYAVNASQVKNGRNITSFENIHIVLRKRSQTDGMTMDERGVLYFGQLADSSIAKLDTMDRRSTLVWPKTIARDPNFVQWPSSFAFNNDLGDLLVLTNALQKFVTRRMSLDEDNFRLLSGNVDAKSYVYNNRPKKVLIDLMIPKINEETSTNEETKEETNETNRYSEEGVDNKEENNVEINELNESLISSGSKLFRAQFNKSALLLLSFLIVLFSLN